MVHPGEFKFSTVQYGTICYSAWVDSLLTNFCKAFHFQLIQKIDLHGICQYNKCMHVFYNLLHSLTVNNSFTIVTDFTCYTVHVYTQFQWATVYIHVCIQKFLTSSLRFKWFGHPRRLCWSIGMPSCISSIRLIVPSRNLKFNKWQQMHIHVLTCKKYYSQLLKRKP